MTYIVLKAPLNSNQPTNLVLLDIQQLLIKIVIYEQLN